MGEILSVEVADEFVSSKTGTLLTVTKIWFEFSTADERWETSVTWNVQHTTEDYNLTAKGREFVRTLTENGCIRVSKGQPSVPSPSVPVPTFPPTTFTSSIDPKRQQWENDFRQNAPRYGLSPSDLGRKVRLGGGRPSNFTIVGAKPRNYKMPILIQGKRGGVYKITAKRAKDGLV